MKLLRIEYDQSLSGASDWAGFLHRQTADDFDSDARVIRNLKKIRNVRHTCSSCLCGEKEYTPSPFGSIAGVALFMRRSSKSVRPGVS
jgi:hypothetical protein